jgi:hypothetical protein
MSSALGQQWRQCYPREPALRISRHVATFDQSRRTAGTLVQPYQPQRRAACPQNTHAGTVRIRSSRRIRLGHADLGRGVAVGVFVADLSTAWYLPFLFRTLMGDDLYVDYAAHTGNSA